jgi:hypothetical protein
MERFSTAIAARYRIECELGRVAWPPSIARMTFATIARWL